jgi:hypothetical protein
MTIFEVCALALALLGVFAFMVYAGRDALHVHPREWPCCDDCGEPTDPEMLSIVGAWGWEKPLSYCPECAKAFAQDHPEFR